MARKQKHKKLTRKEFLSRTIRSVLTGILAGLLGIKLLKSRSKNYVWQINPEKCVQCGRCATECVLSLSAVKCVHEFSMCGYCNLCFGYFRPDAKKLTEDAENQVCPTGAIKRKFIEEPFFEYVINEPLCIGCGKCVKGCNLFGNGSLYLQVRHDRCLNCDECAIARKCAGRAYSRIPVKQGYIRKNKENEESG